MLTVLEWRWWWVVRRRERSWRCSSAPSVKAISASATRMAIKAFLTSPTFPAFMTSSANWTKNWCAGYPWRTKQSCTQAVTSLGVPVMATRSASWMRWEGMDPVTSSSL